MGKYSLKSIWDSLKMEFKPASKIPDATPETHKTCDECNGTGFDDIFFYCEICKGAGIVRRQEIIS